VNKMMDHLIAEVRIIASWELITYQGIIAGLVVYCRVLIREKIGRTVRSYTATNSHTKWYKKDGKVGPLRNFRVFLHF
jgi:hypothetical protein